MITLLRRIALGAVMLLIAAVVLPYVFVPVYRYPPARPFAGDSLYDPYAGPPAPWHRANFHAHAHAWGGLTNGTQSDSAIVGHYVERGYDVPGVSNYMTFDAARAARDSMYLPIYEHGWNVGKVHQLAIGARRVAWGDLLVVRTLDQRQALIDRVHRGADLVALAHPIMRQGVSAAQLRRLAGYELLEVIHSGDVTTDRWDAALSSGRLVWALGDDDTHDLRDPRHTDIAWTMVQAPSPSRRDLEAALAAGRLYAVRAATDAPNRFPLRVDSAGLRGDTLVIVLTDTARIRFIGQGGTVLAESPRARRASYVVRAGDAYVRADVARGAFRLLLQPVVRWDGRALPRLRATVDMRRTVVRITLRLLALSAAVTIVALAAARRRAR